MKQIETDVNEKLIPVPTNITSVLRGVWSMGALTAATNLKIFDALADGPEKAEVIAERCGITHAAARVIARALAGLDLLTLDPLSERFSLSEEAAIYLVSDQPLYLGHYIEVHSKIQSHWQSLEEVARRGEPVTRVNEEGDAQSFFPELAASLFAMNYSHASQVADRFQALIPEDRPFRVLDLACGSGVWSIPLAKESAGVKVDALDFEAVLDVTRRFTENNGVADSYQYLVGDWRQVDLGEENYDLVLLGHILHSEGIEDSGALLDAVTRALKKGGHVVIAEFVIGDCGTKPAAVAMFAINMFILTSRGCVFSQKELSTMLKDRGYENIEALAENTSYEAMVLIGQKKS